MVSFAAEVSSSKRFFAPDLPINIEASVKWRNKYAAVDENSMILNTTVFLPLFVLEGVTALLLLLLFALDVNVSPPA